MTGVLRIAALSLLVAAPLLGADQAKKRNYHACLKGLSECDREMLTWRRGRRSSEWTKSERSEVESLASVYVKGKQA